MPFVIGENIGPYRLVEQLGQGGMATVFKAYHPALDRYVAIKALHPALTGEPDFLVRFQREAQVVARLEHPNTEVVLPLPTLRPPKLVWSTLQSTGTLSQTGQIETALAGVQQAPQSASAYLDLAIAYGAQGMPEEAQKAFKTAVGLAAVPADFYELAGDRIAEREAWGLAASMYLEALNRVPDPAPETLLNKINQTLYLAANTPEIQAILAKAPANRLSPGIIEAVRARGAIYRGEAVLLRAAIRRIKTQFPDNPTVHLLDAELLNQSGDVEQAKRILTSLIDDPNTPEWVHWVAEYLLKKA